ncbi:unnamed protein product [Acanthoscelides obtectus]|uniref:Uncharacterized protein n=1 Tax=Acanthoscelides obtectus TaxID=200917 RepID=A0A9P0KAR6_ACAOB|nr:unnamed protein product [Acanthoscelides obtectus]CAK1666517.1 hypothetical protein AOBTE_LOCUS25357 [Acanthoscelides obtectus]
MKYWHGIKETLLRDKSKPAGDEDAGQKGAKVEDNMIPRPTGTGDFDYESYCVKDSEDDYGGRLTEENETFDQRFHNDVEKHDALLQRLGDDIDETKKEYFCCAGRLEEMEKEVQKRMELKNLCSHMFKEQLPKIERSLELIQNFGDSLTYQNEVLDSWHCFIEEFRKIPEERILHGERSTCHRE